LFITLQVGWYNDQVIEKFRFPYPDDTLALLVVSTPDLFDKGLVPFIQKQECLGKGDVLDCCIREQFENVKKVR